MKRKEFGALYRRYLKDALPGTAMRGTVLHVVPVGDLLTGCHFETSGFARTDFVLHAFVDPLYVPFDALNLTYGRRLGWRQERWFHLSEESEDEAMREALRLIKAQALPMFERFRTAADFARHGAELVSNRESSTFIEAVAYSHVLAGDYEKGRAGVVRVLELMRADDDLLPYEQEMVRRNQQFLLKLRDRPEEAVADLHGWRRETLRAIGFKDAPSILE